MKQEIEQECIWININYREEMVLKITIIANHRKYGDREDEFTNYDIFRNNKLQGACSMLSNAIKRATATSTQFMTDPIETVTELL